MSRHEEKHWYVDTYYSLKRHGKVWGQRHHSIHSACLRNIEFQTPLCETPAGMLIIPENETLAPKSWLLYLTLHFVGQSLSIAAIYIDSCIF